jgi:hypothetical protein
VLNFDNKPFSKLLIPVEELRSHICISTLLTGDGGFYSIFLLESFKLVSEQGPEFRLGKTFPVFVLLRFRNRDAG